MDREDGTEPHAAGIETGVGVTADVAEDLVSARAGGFAVGHQRGDRAVGDLAGVADGDRAVATIEDGFEFRQRVERLVGAGADVFGDRFEAVAGEVGDDFSAKPRSGLRRELVRAQGKFILLRARDVPLLRQDLRGLAHDQAAGRISQPALQRRDRLEMSRPEADGGRSSPIQTRQAAGDGRRFARDHQRDSRRDWQAATTS